MSVFVDCPKPTSHLCFSCGGDAFHFTSQWGCDAHTHTHARSFIRRTELFTPASLTSTLREVSYRQFSRNLHPLISKIRMLPSEDATLRRSLQWWLQAMSVYLCCCLEEEEPRSPSAAPELRSSRRDIPPNLSFFLFQARMSKIFWSHRARKRPRCLSSTYL